MTVPNITFSTTQRLTKEQDEWMDKYEEELNAFCDSPEFTALMEKGVRDLFVYGTSIMTAGEIEGAFKAWHTPYLEALKEFE
jgi:hypothetical protein